MNQRPPCPATLIWRSSVSGKAEEESPNHLPVDPVFVRLDGGCII